MSVETLTEVELIDGELLLLDGHCRPDVQREIDHRKAQLATVAARPDLTPNQATFLADALAEATTQGRLVLRYERLSHCRVCDARKGYARRTRTSRSGAKGTLDYKRPLHLAGVELAHRFISMEGYPSLGCCRACWDILKPHVAAELDARDVHAAIPESITGHAPRWIREDVRHCTACGWEGREGLMGKLPSLMGGLYPGVCPSCGAKNEIFGRTIIGSAEGNGWEIVPSAPRLDAGGEK